MSASTAAAKVAAKAAATGAITILENPAAYGIVCGCACLGIAWGVMNVMLVSHLTSFYLTPIVIRSNKST
jgi:hypothetical protein